MSNYEYANGTGLSVLSQQIFEHLTPLVESVKVFFLASYDRENPPKIGKYIENEDGNSIWATEDNAIFAMEPWSDTPPERLPGMYLWTYTEAIFKDGSIYNSDPVCLVTWDDIDNAVNGMTASLETGLALKADKATTYTKTEVDNFVDTGTVTSEAANPLVIETDAAQYAKNTHLTLEPVQDLHGYDHPWPAGGGKNLLPMTVDGIKAANTHGTWNGNAFTAYNITYTLNVDGAGNIVSIIANGNTSVISFLNLPAFNFVANTSYILSGGVNRDSGLYVVVATHPDTAADTDKTVSFTNNETRSVQIVVYNTSANNAVFKPMIRLASVSDATFAPYSNICPISGLDEVKVERTGFNQWDEEWEVGAVNSDGSLDSSSNRRTTSFISVIPNITYFQQSPTTAYVGRYAFYNADKQIVKFDTNGVPSGTKEVTAPENAHYLRITFGVNYGTTYNHDICINISDAEKNGTYEPYKGSAEVNIDLPETVYGGTLDLETGEVVVNMGSVTFGNLDWSASSSSSHVFRTDSLHEIIKPPIRYETSNALCTSFFAMGYVPISANDNGAFAVATIDYSTISGRVVVIDHRYSTIEDFVTGNLDTRFVYELATPKTYQLTPQQLALFKGTSNISTNAKTVQVTYRNGELATLEELNAISFDLSNVKSKLPSIIIKDGMLQVTYDDGQ